jgi:spermidine synthase
MSEDPSLTTPLPAPQPATQSATQHHSDDDDDDRDPVLDAADALDPAVRAKLAVLLGSVLLVAMCSIIYELIIGTITSYLLGNSVLHFSLTIGLYMSAMGVGSYLSRFVRRDLLANFFRVELGVGILGGASSFILFTVFAISPRAFQPAMWIVTILIGTLVGLEIPLLTRHIRRYAELRVAIASVLSWDYIGSLVGSLAFPLILLPLLGLLNAAAIVGMVNLLVAGIGLWAFRDELAGHKKSLIISCVAALALLATLFATSKPYERFLDRFLFQDPVVFKDQTPYQKLVLTSWKDDYRLFINGNLQFASVDEYRYHEALVHIPMAAAQDPRDVLILGGGDGLAMRQLRRYPELKSVVMVDLDPGMTRLASQNPILKRLNEDAFSDPRLTVINDDAMNYVMETDRQFDVIIIDLPDPNNESLAKLYSTSFYQLIARRLRPTGAMVTQSTAVYFSPNAFWSIHRSVEAAFCPEAGCAPGAQLVQPYHVWIPTFGDWGFNLATHRPVDPTKLLPKVASLEFLSPELIPTFFVFPPDVAERDVKPNRLIEPILLTYYLRDWHKFNQQ